MSLKAGTYEVLAVERESPFGYFLSNGHEDVLLHHSETNQQELKIGEEIKVFLYNDHKGRIAATLQTPKLVFGDVGFLEVTGFQPKVGYFLDNGIGKDVLLPISELPKERKLWPNLGDRLLVTFNYDKQGRLLAELVVDELKINQYITKQREIDHNKTKLLKQNQTVKGIVIHHFSVGALVLTDTNHLGFIHRSVQIKELRLGEQVEARVAFIREDGKVNLSMRPLKEVGRIEDAERILQYLKERGGAMPYWDKTPPEILMEKFHLSKAAFKRAMGKLMKDGLVYQEEGWTYLKENHDV
ncbi:CvfB family protein [Tepidibacillus fermentans]|uniref:S1 motif domain-containing protein n=1 Tax=Tepidibacillus fermentans TaxID=1281767 RepID=A0A4R3KKK9_9BACI|nr:S1-like domain-containing RNA-binding protein [Tepidibacillus fermentans]TCS83781.1 hypothetical protein EDD72_103105 [Tepidibacillus fermentans]